MEELGYGQDYKYAHDFEDHFVEQQYLPDALRNERLWHPQRNAAEDKLAQRMEQLWGERFKP